MSEITDAAAQLTLAAERAEATTDFFDNVTTGDETSTVTNPNNSKTVPTIQKQVRDLVGKVTYSIDEPDVNDMDNGDTWWVYED